MFVPVPGAPPEGSPKGTPAKRPHVPEARTRRATSVPGWRAAVTSRAGAAATADPAIEGPFPLPRDATTVREGHVANEVVRSAATTCHQVPVPTLETKIGEMDHKLGREGAAPPVLEITTFRRSGVAPATVGPLVRPAPGGPWERARFPPSFTGDMAPSFPRWPTLTPTDGGCAPPAIPVDAHLETPRAPVAARDTVAGRSFNAPPARRGRPVAITDQTPMLEPGSVLASLNQTRAGALNGPRRAGRPKARPS